MPDVVYDGVDGKYEGTLFGGVKFYVHLRVPMRSKWIESIRSNGGKLVQLEKFADVRIADHARKDAPSGSVSWKYIEDSVKEGELRDINAYTKNPGPSQHPVASTQPAKATRNKFTPEEDRLLRVWVLEQEHLGEKLGGNKIYQIFAETHPTHTWQSWKDRWVKHLAFRPVEDFQMEEPQEHQDEDRRREEKAPEPSRHATPPPAPNPQPDSVSPQTGRGRQKFTKEDDQILVKWIEKCRRNDESLKGNVIYKILAEKYPHHSFHSWRDRWVRILSKRETLNAESRASTPSSPDQPLPGPREEPKERNTSHHKDAEVPRIPEQESETARPTKSADVKSSPAGPSRHIPEPEFDTAQSTKSADARSSPAGPSHQITPIQHTVVVRSPNTRRRELDERYAKIRAAKTIKSVWRGYRARKELSEAMETLEKFHAHAKGYLLRRDLGEYLEEAKPEDEDTPLDSIEAIQHADEDQGLESSVGDRRGSEQRTATQSAMEEFRTNLEVYCQVINRPIPLVQVQGREIDLWGLWRLATAYESPGDRDWGEIAHSLGFHGISREDAQNQLKSAFDLHLADFEEAVKGYQDEDPSSEEEEEEEEQVLDPHSTLNSPAAVFQRMDMDSSPPSAGLKRKFQQAVPSSSLGSSSSNKRARYNLDEEVPETPKLPCQPLDKRVSEAGEDDLEQSDAEQSPCLSRLSVLAYDKRQRAGSERRHSSVENADAEDEDITSSQQLRSEASRLLWPVRPGPLVESEFRSPSTSRSASTASRLSEDRARPPQTRKVFKPEYGPVRRPTSASSVSESNQAPRPTKVLEPEFRPARRHDSVLSGSSEEGFDPPVYSPRPSKPPASLPPPKAIRRSLPAALFPQQAASPVAVQRPADARKVSAPARPAALGEPQLATKQPKSNHTTPLQGSLASKTNKQEVKGMIEHYVSLGYHPSIVITALKATTFVVSEALPIMESLRSGSEIPKNMAGVWTTADDDGLRFIDGTNFGDETTPEAIARIKQAREEKNRLLKKHGPERMKARREYLKETSKPSR
ncbi:TRF2-interacting telomeric protein/Rap1 C terminal domain-containing protein [Echria macrotheca]|uniref:DNA-binding protein RAP1 n=1 Tax=Echria macrotheca TaxID=438768 RepID=A0AAJ0F6F9_9PEZI|nr:TRF2-interacting telomeric protein/Rap1 C terminal domain-containing protein [Echria macrotheca]